MHCHKLKLHVHVAIASAGAHKYASVRRVPGTEPAAAHLAAFLEVGESSVVRGLGEPEVLQAGGDIKEELANREKRSPSFSCLRGKTRERGRGELHEDCTTSKKTVYQRTREHPSSTFFKAKTLSLVLGYSLPADSLGWLHLLEQVL